MKFNAASSGVSFCHASALWHPVPGFRLSPEWLRKRRVIKPNKE